MQKRSLGKTGVLLSPLGFGAMRLPLKGDGNHQIDVVQSVEMIRYAIDRGVNYVDTAYLYHDGHSEGLVGEALKDGYRDKVYLATKLPTWLCRSHADCEAILNTQLERLGTDRADMYLLHGLDRRAWKRVADLKILDFMEKARADGKIRYIGFSFHDDPDCFKEIVDAYPWDFCQIQLNYMDTAFQAGLEGLRYAGSRGLGVIVMEPLKGGFLANDPPEAVAALWARAGARRTPVEWALRWVLDQPEVSCVLSGMASLDMVKENIKIAAGAAPGCVTDGEREIIAQVADTFRALRKVHCTACGYCMPCPSNVDIPGCFEYYNRGHMHNAVEMARDFYNRPLFEKRRAGHCVECGQCMKLCPQHLDIIGSLKAIRDEFE